MYLEFFVAAGPLRANEWSADMVRGELVFATTCSNSVMWERPEPIGSGLPQLDFHVALHAELPFVQMGDQLNRIIAYL